MIDINSFTIQEVELTKNWAHLQLKAIDLDTGKTVCVAVTSFATGASDRYPQATKERAERNISALQKYLQDNCIDTLHKWHESASHKARMAFISAFTTLDPRFNF